MLKNRSPYFYSGPVNLLIAAIFLLIARSAVLPLFGFIVILFLSAILYMEATNRRSEKRSLPLIITLTGLILIWFPLLIIFGSLDESKHKLLFEASYYVVIAGVIVILIGNIINFLQIRTS